MSDNVAAPIDYAHLWNLLNRLPVRALGTVLDIGCGMNHSPISEQVRQIECDRLISVDAAADYIERVAEQTYAAREHICYIMDARSIPFAFEGAVSDLDLVLMIDFIEHLEKEEGAALLDWLMEHARTILIYVPIGICRIATDTYGTHHDDLHTHRSTWLLGDFERRGFQCEFFRKASYVCDQDIDVAWVTWNRAEGE